MYKKLLDNDKGTAIVMALFVTMALIGYTVYFINNVKYQVKISAQSKNDAEVNSLTAEIKNLLVSPANCFTSTARTPKYNKVAVDGSWEQSATGKQALKMLKLLIFSMVSSEIKLILHFQQDQQEL